MDLLLASVSPRGGRSKRPEFDTLVEEYLGRLSGWLRAEQRVFPAEVALWKAVAEQERLPGSTRVVQLDSRGRQMSSEEFAAWVGKCRESTARVILAVGPADGWSAGARTRGDMVLSLGPMTMPHELARVLAAEQVYRAWTILERHPYHSGH